MARHLLIDAVATMALGAMGCVSPLNRALKQPRPDEPHGTITITREYKARPGAQLEEYGAVNGFEAPSTFRQAPGPTVVYVHATFFHLEEKQEWVTRSYTRYETYETSRYNYCAQRDRDGTCHGETVREQTSRPITETRRELETIVTRTNDGQCKADAPLLVRAGEQYQVHYVWESDGTCHATCELRTAAGSSDCPLPPTLARGAHGMPRERVERPLMPFGLGAVAVGGIGTVIGGYAVYAAVTAKVYDDDRKAQARNWGIVLGVSAPVFVGGVVILSLPGKRVVEVVPEAAGASVRGTF